MPTTTSRPRSRTDRGAVLFVSVAILGLLSVLAIALINLTRIERMAAATKVEGRRSHLAALAGIHRTSAEVRDWATREALSDSSGDPWQFDAAGGDLYLRLADADPTTRLSFYGVIARDGHEQGDVVTEYRVRAIDTSTMVDLNLPDDVLPRVLDALGDALAQRRGVADPVAGRGQAIVDARTVLGGRFESRGGAEVVLRGILGQNEMELLRPFVTASAWRDPTAVVTGDPVDAADPDQPLPVVPEGRAPININAAPPEVIAAILTGVAGRFPYRVTTDIVRQEIEQGTPFVTSIAQEETQYGDAFGFVEVGPIPLAAALTIADSIVAARQGAPRSRIESFGHLGQIAQAQAVADGWFNVVPVNAPAGVQTDPGFADALARAQVDLVVSALDPNARTTRIGRNHAAGRLIGKADLVVADAAAPAGIRRTRNTDACLGPTGIFEVSSLGRVVILGGPGPDDDFVFAESEVDVVMQLFAILRHTSQADFDLAGAAGVPAPGKTDVITWPTMEGNAPSLGAGRVEIEPFRDAAGAAIPGAADFAALYQSTAGGAAAYDATQAGPGSTGQAFGDATAGARAGPAHDGGRLVPDGFFNPGGTPAFVRYRAATADTNPDSVGVSADTGNIGMTQGSLEGWFRPDFDWEHSDGTPNPTFSGLFFSCHSQNNPAAPIQPSPTSGTQMFGFRNSSGDLRVVRIYYEVVGTGAAQVPLVRDPMVGDLTDVPNYIERANNSIRVTTNTTTTDLGTQQVGNTLEQTIRTVTTQTTEVGFGYPWPPPGIVLFPNIRFSRREAVIPFASIRNLRADEWHHISVAWNDSDAGAGGLRMFVDGRELGTTPVNAPGAPDAEEFAAINQPPGMNRDTFDVGGVERAQLATGSGVIKFETLARRPAMGTVDDIRTFGAPQGALDPPERYPPDATFNHRLALVLNGPEASRFRAGSISFNAGLPTRYGSLDGVVTAATGAGSVGIAASVAGSPAPGGSALVDRLDAPASFGLGGVPFDPTGPGVDYAVTLESASLGDAFSAATPFLDDVTLRYLPDIIVLEVLPEVEE